MNGRPNNRPALIASIIPLIAALLACCSSEVVKQPDTSPEKVQALWNGKWYDAVILDQKDDKFLIHYEGWSDKWDEWVPEKRIRKRPDSMTQTKFELHPPCVSAPAPDFNSH